MAHGDANEKLDPSRTPEGPAHEPREGPARHPLTPAAAGERSVPEPIAPTPAAPALDPTGPRPPEPGVQPPSGAAPAPPAAATSGAAPGAASPPPPPKAPAPSAPRPTPAAAREASEPAAASAPPVDETADLVRVGQMGSGRRLLPVDDDTLQSIRSFACDRPLPGLGTLLELARAHATSGRGPGLSVEVFSEIRSQLGRIVAELEAIAIHVGPVLFVKTIAKNQPGTALRWLTEDERRALREHPEFLDHPGRLTARLKKLLAGEAEAEDAAADPD